MRQPQTRCLAMRDCLGLSPSPSPSTSLSPNLWARQKPPVTGELWNPNSYPNPHRRRIVFAFVAIIS
ncbi:uncharacterized protein DMAD_13143 [Drosophila madeirensis]|uniref:Uncharacterized protein n=1 Tax=Drosophila madeirensis TaxID=30013 RepID=A0AAU9FJ84_DROMD